MEGCCEHGNEPSGSIKCWKILQTTEQLWASPEGLKSTELVSQSVSQFSLVLDTKYAAGRILLIHYSFISHGVLIKSCAEQMLSIPFINSTHSTQLQYK
jgi:hypothetical protein